MDNLYMFLELIWLFITCYGLFKCKIVSLKNPTRPFVMIMVLYVYVYVVASVLL